ncbi:hydrogenase formation protein HypD [bacterium]|nr:hydrogenase formation protein HypD [bacterium]
MKYLDEYRDADAARRYADAIAAAVTQPWTMMEICGGQTHAIVKYGVDELLPDGITLVHGPGCPVCVTPIAKIDAAIELARRPNVILTSFGDMLRVPGTETDLLAVKAAGADVRMVYSPVDAVKIARANPDKEVIFFAVGFETTAPANAMAVYQAARLDVPNFSVLVSHVLVPPAIEAILSSPTNRVQAFLAAGHVCTVMGTGEYYPIAEKYHVPIVVTGFEPVDILQGILMAVRQLEAGRAEVENPYNRVVRTEANETALRIMGEVFRVGDREWRGIGTIPQSGYELAPDYEHFDAERRFDLSPAPPAAETECQSGLVLQGVLKPCDCPAFGTRCTPDKPLGAPMVSNEGACAAYYRYRRG